VESNPNNKRTILIITLLLICIIVVALIVSNINRTKASTYDALWDDIKAGNVKELKFSDTYTVYATLNDGSQYYVIVVSRTFADDVLAYCQTNDVAAPTITLTNPNSGTSWTTIISVLSFVIIAVLAIILIVSMRGKNGANGALNFGKTKPRVAANVKVRFSDVAGAEEEKTELREIVDFLKNPKKFVAIGAKIPRGVLLVGPPGTGKTLFAKAVAGEADVPFFSISGSDFVEMFVGVGASRVRDLFAQAKKNMPCIIFIDEIDAVGRQRGAGLGGGNDEREQTLNQLLVQMDGFDTNDGIIVMAATNRADILDPALLRPGRFDRQIFVNIPDVKGREEIFKVHARNKPINSDVDFRTLARMTSGFSGADIANLLNEAAILAARNDRKVILMKDILESINKVIAGPQKKSRVITESDKRITAYHEAGHAIVGRLMRYCDAVQEVSIIPRGMAAGYTLSRPKNDNSHVTINKLNDEIAMMLGGRASEEIIIQDISAGASNDIKRATEIARKMVTEWGMSAKLPNLFYGTNQEVFIGRDYQTQVNYSNEVAAIIDEEIKKIIEENYKRAYDCISSHRDILENMVKLLYEHETIYTDEVDMLIDGNSVEEIDKYIEKKQNAQDEDAKKYNAPIIPPVFKPASTIIVPGAPDGKSTPDGNPPDDNASPDADKPHDEPQNNPPEKQ
jgi:cell division protease FtsH